MSSVTSARHLLLSVSGETTVPVELLVENEDFMELIREGNTEYQELVDWVNENY